MIALRAVYEPFKLHECREFVLATAFNLRRPCLGARTPTSPREHLQESAYAYIWREFAQLGP